MTEIFSGFLIDLLTSAYEAFDGVMMWILDGMLRVERLFGASGNPMVSAESITSVYRYIYGAAGILLILKFLFKGFSIYILWRDGDPDNSPQDMLIGSLEGVVVMLTFPYLYDIMADFTLWFASGIMERFGFSTNSILSDTVLNPASLVGLSLFYLIFLLIYLILIIVLMVKLMQRGLELLILRLGIPIACMGLVDSDKGIFKGYIQIFYKTMFTSVIQVVLLSWSLRVMTMVSLPNLFFGIVLIIMAFGTPLLMQQILIATGHGGGGVGQKLYSASMMSSALRRMMGR